MGDLLNWLRDNWAVIAEAPLAFALWTAILLGLCWFVVSYLKSNQIGNLESRISLRDDEISDYKRKLDGASPEEARDRIEKLEAEVASLKPRRLEADQAKKIKEVASKKSGSVSVATDIAVSDAKTLSGGIAAAFNAAGWVVSTPMVMGPSFNPACGLGVTISNEIEPTDQERSVMGALDAAGLTYEVLARSNYASESVEILVTSKID